MYFGIYGIFIGAILGAFIGEFFAGKESNDAIHQAVSSFVYFIIGTIFQVIVCGIFMFYFIEEIRYVL